MFPLYDLNPHHRIPWLTGLLILGNAAMMLWLQGMGQREAELTVVRHGFVPQRLTHLDGGQPVVVQLQQPHDGRNPIGPKPKPVVLPASAREVYLSLLTMMFLHGGWIHLTMNMWMLWVFGNNIEDKLGHVMFVVFYLLGGLIASIVQWMSDPQSAIPVIGASGAVATVLGGYALTFPTAKVKCVIFFGMILVADLPALLVLGVWFVFEMVQGVGLLGGMMDNVPVAFWAHIGGFLAGVALIPVFSLGASPPETDWQSETDRSFQFDEMVR